MLEKRIDLFRIFGFRVSIDPSWVIIVILVTWTLSVGFFPFEVKNLSTQTYWLMGLTGALGLFVSIIFHEVSHSLVARRFGIPMKGITLFIFGGVAEMNEEPPSPKAEFLMAVVGPLSSIAIGFAFYGIYVLGMRGGWPDPLNGVILYLAMINLVLAVFNLVPAFPLDGGRVLRSILWGLKKNLRWATRISSMIGSGFGILLIILGIIRFFRGNFIGGMWWFLIGMFLRGAAKMSYQQLMTRKALEGEAVRRFMMPDPVTVSPFLSLEELVKDYLYKYHFKMFPVVDGERLVGCVTSKQIRDIPKEEWSEKRVEEITQECSKENTISPDADATAALSLMHKTGSSRLMVTEDGHLVGIIALKDMLKFLSIKVELEE